MSFMGNIEHLSQPKRVSSASLLCRLTVGFTGNLCPLNSSAYEKLDTHVHTCVLCMFIGAEHAQHYLLPSLPLTALLIPLARQRGRHPPPAPPAHAGTHSQLTKAVR